MEEGDDYSFDLGNLSFDEAVEAFNELNGCFGEKYEELVFVVIWAFNDMIRENLTPTVEQYAKFKDIVSGCIKNPIFNGDGFFRAELFREIGEFEECMNILNAYEPEEECFAIVKEKIIERAKERDSKVFVIEQ